MSEPQTIGPLCPVTFEMGEGIFRTKWQVTLEEDGTLSIFPTGRRAGRILVLPCSHTSISVTTERLVTEAAQKEAR